MSQEINITKHKRTERPDPAWVRGRCPECGDEIVSHLYYIAKQGYVLKWRCWSAEGESPTCSWEKVL
jgi:hypothetical protein